ncbi:MAG: VWA domain-containing protein, partial [Pseudomonadota bacterium]|nr:VWA domain-containing protein [Pseudomonadota bacterium]
MQLAYPYVLLLVSVLIPLLYLYQRRGIYGRITMPSIAPLRNKRAGQSRYLRHLLLALRVLAILCIIGALARPQLLTGVRIKETEGLDLMLLIDTSASMRALDFVAANNERKDRLAVVKEVIADFIKTRHNDRIGMIVFGEQAFIQAPLTSDHDILLEFLAQTEIGMAGDSTAIGDAIGVSVNRFKNIQAKSKVAILLTDGENTAGIIDPTISAKIASDYDVKIYTIGIGSNEAVPVPHAGQIFRQQLPLDEGLLQDIAKQTGGKYFKASD